MPFDPYQLLQVQRGATDSEIRRAYRLLARQCHPDVNKEPGAEQRFKELSLAYSVLSDRRKRALYDRHGEVALTIEFQQQLARQEAERQPSPASPLDLLAQVEIDAARASAGGTLRVASPLGGAVLVRIPAGVKSGTRIRLPGKGRASPGRRPGDLFVEVLVRGV